MSLQGVFAPTLTPVKPDLSPDTDRLIAHCRRLLDRGCHGLALFGTTSEANSFSVGERMAVLEELVAAGIPAAKFMPGTGCAALSDSIALTKQAVDLGCAGVLMLPPFYYKGMTDQGLFNAFAAIIDGVADDRLQIYLYHIPPVAQVPTSHNLIEMLITAYPKTVVGMKDSSGDWNNMQTTLERFPGFRLFTGTEKYLLATMRGGGVGTICATANVIADRVRHLYENWQSPQADQLQADLMQTRDTIFAHKLQPIAALKAITAATTGDDEWLRVRPPLESVTDQQAAALMADLAPIFAQPV